MSEAKNDLTALLGVTREGNKIAPAVCNLRESIAWNSNTLCADCKHVLDACKWIKNNSRTLNGHREITWCEGFEHLNA